MLVGLSPLRPITGRLGEWNDSERGLPFEIKKKKTT